MLTKPPTTTILAKLSQAKSRLGSASAIITKTAPYSSYKQAYYGNSNNPSMNDGNMMDASQPPQMHQAQSAPMQNSGIDSWRPKSMSTPATSFARPNNANSIYSSNTLSNPTYKPFNNNNSTNTNTTTTQVGTSIFPQESIQTPVDIYSLASTKAFSAEITDILQRPLNSTDIQVKPDGALYLPESKYRRILSAAFGVGGWSMVPLGPHSLNANVLSREWALLVNGRFIGQARGQASTQFNAPAMASEGAKSNALMRCCKDLGIGSELWDATFCNQWRLENCLKTFENGKVKWSKASSSSAASHGEE